MCDVIVSGTVCVTDGREFYGTEYGADLPLQFGNDGRRAPDHDHRPGIKAKWKRRRARKRLTDAVASGPLCLQEFFSGRITATIMKC